ncbi:MAG: hypothetical protein C0607_18800 [Azoarcus sp.]|nr:MAG: hypothetical protein C0607_18800 [Azoarcus sp.]TVT58915.1 MAG: DUF2933 domain-containing protein [Azoarcus sp. PHD]
MKAQPEAEPSPADRGSSNLRGRRVFVVFVVLAAVLLIAEHRLHVFGYLPWLILLACPLMHVFMHRGHGDKGKRTPAEDQGNHDA